MKFLKLSLSVLEVLTASTLIFSSLKSPLKIAHSTFVASVSLMLLPVVHVGLVSPLVDS